MGRQVLILNGLLILAICIFTKYYSAYGYPYGIIVMNVLNFFLLFVVCKRLAAHINYKALLKYAGLIFLINIPLAAGFYFLEQFFVTGVFMTLFISFVLYCMILLFLNKQWHLCHELELFRKRST